MVLFNNFIGFVVHFTRQWETWAVAAVGDMDYSYDKKAPGCKIVTMEYIVYMFLTNSPTDTHHLNNNPPHWVYPDNINPVMDDFPEKAHYENSGKRVITYDGHYKVINNKEYNVKYFILKFST